jgi:FkbM family methyltransferase
MTFSSLLDSCSCRDFYFIQVGANDGLTDDDVRPHVLQHGWRGVLIEPLPEVFERLRWNYRDSEGLFFENSAVTERDGAVMFYRHPRLPQCSGLGIRTKRQSRVRMRELEVSGVSFHTLFQKYSVSRIDLLQVDAEGFDEEIVRFFPYEEMKPRIIRYEHKHISRVSRGLLGVWLHGKGYAVFEEGADTIAFLQGGDHASRRKSF